MSAEDYIEELGLGAPRGRSKTAISMTVLRELNAADLPALAERPAHPTESPGIQNLRQSHHQLAALLARGVEIAEVSLITGYSPNYISILRGSPAFKDLEAKYVESAELKRAEGIERLRSLGVDAAEELMQRLSEEPEKLTTSQLMDLAKLGIIEPERIKAEGRRGAANGGVAIAISFVDSPEAAQPRPKLIEGEAQECE
jgi:hypothetical protein